MPLKAELTMDTMTPEAPITVEFSKNENGVVICSIVAKGPGPIDLSLKQLQALVSFVELVSREHS